MVSEIIPQETFMAIWVERFEFKDLMTLGKALREETPRCDYFTVIDAFTRQENHAEAFVRNNGIKFMQESIGSFITEEPTAIILNTLLRLLQNESIASKFGDRGVAILLARNFQKVEPLVTSAKLVQTIMKHDLIKLKPTEKAIRSFTDVLLERMEKVHRPNEKEAIQEEFNNIVALLMKRATRKQTAEKKQSKAKVTTIPKVTKTQPTIEVQEVDFIRTPTSAITEEESYKVPEPIIDFVAPDVIEVDTLQPLLAMLESLEVHIRAEATIIVRRICLRKGKLLPPLSSRK
ncbi:hypothetical protein HDU76_012944 [Blyttiomyces sp. JEL0837]|nr:hypothetical protein HDU76_012944 [Blyttiomyces sp. JEL0837]